MPGYDPVTKENVYPCTVHLGVLTATRPIGARLRFGNIDGRSYEGTIRDLTRPEDREPGPFYRLHLDVGTTREPDVLEFLLPLSHEVTLLTGPLGRPEDGHTFRIEVTIRGSSGIMAEGDEAPHDYQDDEDFSGSPYHVFVRAWDMPSALRKASEISLPDWKVPNGVSLWHARAEDFDPS